MSSSLSPRYHSLLRTYGTKHVLNIRTSRILVVGAGGIGCEILKNLALSGFVEIHVIDLDTIDVSNLNRQFLFRPEHVGQSKAIIAADATKRFNPDVRITANHGNIKDAKFGTSYFKTFDVVLNALDNIDARKHVNRLCLATNVPLIDAGTQGYIGQIMPIYKDITACYECNPKPTQRVYPICTIRSTPDKPVHCIVWAKEFFKLAFGDTRESMLYEDPASGDTSVYMHLFARSAMPIGQPDAVVDYVAEVVKSVFSTEIVKRIGMDTYKTAKFTPQPVDCAMVDSVCRELRGSSSSNMSKSGWDRAVFSASECIAELVACFHSYMVGQPERLGSLSFDKDDDVTMRFVSAAANLRSQIFGIPTLCFHDAKGIAGNIIPAIATTNAIVAGVQVQYAINLLKPELSMEDRIRSCAHVYCLRAPTRQGYYLQPTKPEGPNSKCFVCQTAQVTIQVDTDKMTLQELVSKILKAKLGFNEPSVMIQMSGSTIFEEGSGADEDLAENLPLALSQCPGGGVKDGTVLSIDDFSQDLSVNIVVVHVDIDRLTNSDNETIAADLFVVGEASVVTKAEKEVAEVSAASKRTEGEKRKAGDSIDVDTDDIEVSIEEAPRKRMK